MSRVLLTTVFLLMACLSARSGEAVRDAYARVDVEPTTTSIYIGVVSMRMPPFVRMGESYVSSYEARVIPYFFYNEKGSLTVDVPASQLEHLARGETIEFTGRAVRADGEVRRVEGRATPQDPTQGKLKVRVFVSRKIQLIFNTTYRFAPREADAGGAAASRHAAAQ